jgi:ABC-type multidrug transport system ATPase subunit
MKMLLEFDGIEKSFGGRSVLSSVYMKCQTGSVVGLMGRNGSGKSTLMKIVFGTMNTPFKSVRLNGNFLAGGYLSDRIIGYLPQSHFIPEHLSVHQALQYFEIQFESVTTAFPEYSEFRHLAVGKLSGGFRRLLESFLMLKSNRSFIMLDEPFSGIMPLHIEALKKIMSEEKLNKGIIVSDHLDQHTLDLSDTIYLLANGKTYLIKDRDELIFRGYLQSNAD